MSKPERPLEEDLNRYDSSTFAWWKWPSLLYPPVLFTLVALMLLTFLWSSTLYLIDNGKAQAEHTAAQIASDAADTYEAQVLGALRDIERTLDLVRYNLEKLDPQTTIKELRARELLLPGLLFSVGVVDVSGKVVAGELFGDIEGSIAEQDFFKLALKDDNIVVSLPYTDPEWNELRLYFGQRVKSLEGSSGGVVILSAPASFFVSAYESEVLGVNGVLGLAGTDGVFRVLRTGDVISGAETINRSLLLDDGDIFSVTEVLEYNSWDDIQRYTVVKNLFRFPLAIVVGVSREEKLAAASQLSETYITRAAASSVGVIAVLAMLGSLSWRLQREQGRVIKERLANAERVEYLAYYDTLTNLPNRANFSRLLNQYLQKASRYDNQIALLFLDLDGFKYINDSLGHRGGDELLRLVGQRVRDVVRESDIVARLGGDEFVVMLPEIASDIKVSVVAQKILSAVALPIEVASHIFRVTVSIGISIYPVDGEDEQKLMLNADLAMYHAKRLGKNNVQFFSEKLNTEMHERLVLESRLRSAIDRDEFRLVYQPKLDLGCDRITGVEALLRWNSPDIGEIPPDKFIPLAEETGLIGTIGLWVLRTACHQCVTWQKEGVSLSSLAVNLSPRQFNDPDLYNNIISILQNADMDPGLLELEITEGTLIEDLEWTIHILRDLKARGIRIAIDDFGTGYSSLSAIKKLPIDSLKIDRSFIQDLTGADGDRSLVDTIIAVAKNLGLRVVAEGVESADQVEYLRMRLCDEIQGFYISKPLPAEKITLLLRGQIQ